MRVVRLICILALATFIAVVQERGYRETHPSRREELGKYFVKKKYIASPLPQFEQMRSQLPSPIYDENPLWTELYWKVWALAFKNFHEPCAESGFVSQFIDAAFNDNVFLWDTSFMTMFCSLAHPLVPGIASLDNFYVKQHESGEICREIKRESGLDFIPWANANDASLDAPKNELRWRITSHKRVGCEHYRFDRHVVTLMTEPSTGRLTVNSDGAFTLRVLRGTSTKKFAVNPGANTFSLNE